MVSGETLLKFTDYPFAYSFVGIISAMIGFSLGQNQLIFLGIAGAVGTFLTIIDPIGGGLRKNAETRIKKASKKKKLDDLKIQFKLSSLKSKSISYEMEKIIGMFYFVIIISLFMLGVFLPTPFFEKLVILDGDEEPLCSEWCFKFSYLGLSLAALVIISEKGRRFWRELDRKVDIAADHMDAINDDNATQTSVESMTRAIEQNDWELAELWGHKIEDEIINQKGKRESTIKAADTIFSPLHSESSEFEKHLKKMKQNRQFTEFKTEQWDHINQHSLQSMVEDEELRHKIENFYKIMNDYNELTPKLFLEMGKIINKNFSDVFKKNVSGVEFHLDSPDSGDTVHLHDCAMSEIHPLNFYFHPRKFGGFKISTRNGNQVHHSLYEQQSSFDTAWNLVLEDVKNNEIIIKIKKYLKDLEIENEKLMKIYSDKIKRGL